MKNSKLKIVEAYRNAFGSEPRLSRDSVLREGISLYTWRTNTPKRINVAAADTLVLILHLSGSDALFMEAEQDEVLCSSCVGDVSLIPAGQIFSLQTDSMLEIAVLSLPDTAPPPSEPAAWNRLLRIDSCVLAFKDEFASATMKAFINAIEAPPKDGLLYFCQMFDSLIFHLARISDSYRHSQEPESAKVSAKQIDFIQLIGFMEAHLAEKMDLKLLAKYAGVSRSYFAKAFRQEFGVSPHQFIIRQRIEYAKKYLRQKDKSVTDIAHELGFCGQSHFSTTFKSMTGFAPKDYSL